MPLEKLNSLSRALRNLWTARQRSSAGSNCTLWRLVRNGSARYLCRQGFAFKPLSLFMIINGRCNLACRFCDVGQGQTDSMFYRNLVDGDFDFDRFAALMEEVQPFRPFISITSTEPLLYGLIQDAVALVKGHGLEMNITTNGVLLERHAEGLVRNGLDKITVSVDGPPDVHDAIRGIPGTYERAMKGIAAVDRWKREFATDRPTVNINTTICDLNAEHLERFLHDLPWEQIGRVGLMPMVFLTEQLAENHNRRWGGEYPATPTCLAGEVDLEAIDTDRLCRTIGGLKQRYGPRLHLYFRNEGTYLRKFFREPEVFLEGRNCLFPWFAAQISAQGDLLGLTRCYATSFGNVLDEGFLAAWNGPKMRKFRRDLQRLGSFPACSRCEGVLAR